MPKRIPECAVTTHAQTCDGAHFGAAESAIVAVDIRHKFAADKGFELHFGVDRRIKVPTVLSIRTYHHHTILGGYLLQIFLFGPIAIVAGGTMEHIHRGKTIGGIVEILVGQHHHRFNFAVHFLTHHLHGVGLEIHRHHIGGDIGLCHSNRCSDSECYG